MSKFEKNLFDARTKKSFMHQGLLSQKEWDKNIKDLPDLTDQCDELTVYEESEELLSEKISANTEAASLASEAPVDSEPLSFASLSESSEENS